MNFLKDKIAKDTRLNSLINFIIEVLLITNLWIVIFHAILDILSYIYSPTIKESFYREAAVFPEPFKIPLYVVLSFLFVIFIILFRKALKRFNQSDQPNVFVKLIILSCLLFIFISKLGSFPLGNEPTPNLLNQNKNIYDIFLFTYGLSIAVILVESVFLERLLQKKRWFKPLLYFAVGITIAFFIFEPHFPILPYEYSYFLGPIWDVIQGKTIFTNSNSDYGFYSILFFSALYKLGLFQLAHLSIYIWLMFVAQYLLIFYLIYKVSDSLLLSLLGVFAAITINYYSYPLVPITVTQYSAMRRLPAILLLFLLARKKRLDSRLFLLAPALFGFWIIDTGVEMYLALGSTLFLFYLGKFLTLKRFVAAVCTLLIGLVGVFFLINVGHLILGYRLIDYHHLLTSIRQYGGLGLTFIPLAGRDFFWFFMLIYFASVFIVFIREKYETLDQLILLSANLTLFNSFYFVGRSHAANLLDLSVLVILNAFLLFGLLWNYFYSNLQKILVAFFIFLLFIVFPTSQRKYTFAELIFQKFKKIQTGSLFIPESEGQAEKFFSKEKKIIQTHLTSQNVLILSRDDTYLFIVTGKRNLLRSNPQAAIDTKTEMDYAVKDAVSVCPKKIAVDCTLYNRCPNFTSYTKKDFFMAPYILPEIEKRCGIKYSPLECTDKICIVESAKSK